MVRFNIQLLNVLFSFVFNVYAMLFVIKWYIYQLLERNIGKQFASFLYGLLHILAHFGYDKLLFKLSKTLCLILHYKILNMNAL